MDVDWAAWMVLAEIASRDDPGPFVGGQADAMHPRPANVRQRAANAVTVAPFGPSYRRRSGCFGASVWTSFYAPSSVTSITWTGSCARNDKSFAAAVAVCSEADSKSVFGLSQRALNFGIGSRWGAFMILLLQTNWTSAALAEIVKAAIAPFDQGGGRFMVQSTNMEVSPGAVLPLAMVLNELCTNAVKYGALSNPTGRVEITATADDAQKKFRLKWTESGGPPVRAPSHRSFGSRLIEHSFVNQLQGRANLDFAVSGVVCTLDIPLVSLKPPQPI